ncbi:MAG: DUF2087 domain-containing protein [Kineosporiaceae bacterium]
MPRSTPRPDAGPGPGHPAATRPPGAEAFVVPDPVRQPARWAASVPPGQREPVLRTFLTSEGRLQRLPAKLTRRLIVLDHVAQRFQPGVRYSEAEVNDLLRPVLDDVATLRRQLVDGGFCDREHGHYWRSGGTVPA